MKKKSQKTGPDKKISENFENFSPKKKGDSRKKKSFKKEPVSSGVFLRRTLCFVLAFFAVTGGSLWAENALFPDYFPKCALLAGTVFLITGIVYIAVLYYLNGKCGILAEYAIGTSIRTGIPLISALVFFLFLDNILFKYSVLTVVVFYLLLTPLEVWMSLPEQKKITFDSSKKEEDASDEC